jgi:hypothetical protein
VIQCIAEILWLLILSGVAIGFTLLLLRTRTTLTTVMTLTTLGALTTLATLRTRTTLTTLGAFTALTTGRTLHIVGWLLNQHAV